MNKIEIINRLIGIRSQLIGVREIHLHRVYELNYLIKQIEAEGSPESIINNLNLIVYSLKANERRISEKRAAMKARNAITNLQNIKREMEKKYAKYRFKRGFKTFIGAILNLNKHFKKQT